ncbi:hypothetical protein M413DRAFT_435124, partial [Hebeloma cylindrosporum]
AITFVPPPLLENFPRYYHWHITPHLPLHLSAKFFMALSLNSYITKSFFEGPTLTFDDTLLNVPEAQAQAFYDDYETIDDKLGFANTPFEYIPPPPSDPIFIAKQHNPSRFYSRALARIQMEDLDNGTGRMVPSKKLLPSKPRLYSDTQARAQAIEEDRLSRLYDDANPRRVERAYHAAAPAYYTKVDEKTGQLRVVSPDPQPRVGLSDADMEPVFDIDMSGPEVEPIVYPQDHYAEFVLPQTAIRGPPSPGVPPTVDPLDLDPSLKTTVAYRRFAAQPSSTCDSGRAERRRQQSTKKRTAFDPIVLGSRKNRPTADSVVMAVSACSNAAKSVTSRGRKKKGVEVY